MSKIAKIGFGLLGVLLVGGFLCLAIIDIPVKQTQITKTLPNERFFKDN